MSGAMQWRDTGSLGRTGRADEKMKVDLSMAEQLECTELGLGMDDEPAGTLQLRTEVWVTLQGVSATGCQTRQNKWTRASTGNSLVSPGPAPHGGLQPPWQLLGD